MDEVDAVGVDEIREARRAADAGDGADLLVREVELLQRLVERGQHGEITAARAPGRVVCGERFLGELLFKWLDGYAVISVSDEYKRDHKALGRNYIRLDDMNFDTQLIPINEPIDSTWKK